MKEKHLKVLLLVLAVIVAVQAYYLYDLSRPSQERPVLATDILSTSPTVWSFSGFSDAEDDPFAEMERLRRDMENNFRDLENFFQTVPTFRQLTSRLYRTPRFDMKEKDGKYIITLEVPGVKESDIKAKIENGRLLVTAEVTQAKDDNSTRYYRQERRTSSYRSEILLPADIDERSLKREYGNGVLSITIEKKRP